MTLVFGSLNPYEAIPPEHPLWDDFARAWSLQHTWDDHTHFVYWRAALHVWPTKRVSKSEHLALWVWSWRRCGLSDEEIEARLCLAEDTLRRRHDALRRADAIQSELESVDRGKRTRVPLIVTDHEASPHPLDTWYDPRLSECLPESAKRARRELTALTRNGPRGRATVP